MNALVEGITAFSSRRSIRADVISIYVIQFLTLGLGMVAGVVVARTLAPAEKGIVDLYTVLGSFIVEFGLLGFGSGLLYYLANKGRSLAEVHGTGFVFASIMGVLTAVIGWLGLPFWKKVFPGLQGWIILLGFFLSPVAYYRLMWSNIMIGINQAVAIYRIGLCFTVANLLAILALWALGWLEAENLVILLALSAVINGVVAFLVLLRKEPHLGPSADLARKSLRYGLVIYLGFIANAVHFRFDQIMLNYWSGTAAVGIYGLSVRWAERLFLLDSAITAAALYRITISSAEDSHALINRLFKVQLLISGGAGALLAMFAYPLILILYGEAYREAVWPLILLIPGVIAWSGGKVLSQYLSYNQGKVWLPTAFALFGAFVNVVLNLLLIDVIGISGAAVSSTVSYGSVVVLTIIAYRKQEVPNHEKTRR